MKRGHRLVWLGLGLLAIIGAGSALYLTQEPTLAAQRLPDGSVFELK